MIYMIGVSKDVPLNIRQKLSFTKSRLMDALLSIKLYVEGCVILSTCNRTEIYVEGDNKVDEIIDILGFRDFKDTFFYKEERECIEHLLNVACGFYSNILGEEQILGQVRDALIVSEELKVISGTLKRLFDVAISCGKEFRFKSSLYKYPVSSSSIVIDYCRKNGVKRYMLIGYGDVNRLTAKYILSNEFDILYIAVRDVEKVNIEDKRVVAINFKDKAQYIRDVEGIICATSAPHTVLRRDELKDFRGYIFDLAVPRDVEDVKDLVDVVYFDIDTVTSINDRNVEMRRRIMEENRYIIQKYRDEFINYIKIRGLSDVIRKLQKSSDNVYKKRLKRYINKYPDSDFKTLEILFKSTSDAYVNRAIEVLKQELIEGRGEECLRIVEKIFMI
ncbi:MULTISPECIES: glutamyl-tRNA reductase [Caloramator]|uniref:Glutamyl-tRNA reductase n=1 Tax=Caloramator proteoclasticus DSM 10124 TaxID=1121262 RepID=A0A1M4S9B6_9CLOT|nr:MULTISPECIES: glutamyl-tRNA reductase [Caloramator]SHE28799.1 glutamyl-tRNA reductase [Caloramator proteoclasticus DSM 10124]